MTDDAEFAYEITVVAADMTAAEEEALFDRVADAAHDLDQQVVCSGKRIRLDDTEADLDDAVASDALPSWAQPGDIMVQVVSRNPAPPASPSPDKEESNQ